MKWIRGLFVCFSLLVSFSVAFAQNYQGRDDSMYFEVFENLNDSEIKEIKSEDDEDESLNSILKKAQADHQSLCGFLEELSYQDFSESAPIEQILTFLDQDLDLSTTSCTVVFGSHKESTDTEIIVFVEVEAS